MKILMISADPKILTSGSEAAKRIHEYRALADDVRVIVIAGSHNIGGFFRAWQEGSRVLSEWNKDDVLITSQDPFERGLLAWLLAWRFGAPFELQIHTDFLSPWFWRESMKNKIRVALALFLIPRVTTVRVVSERIKQSLVERCAMSEECITILPINVIARRRPRSCGGATWQSSRTSTGLLRSARNDAVFTFLMVSRLTKEKNIPLALRAFREVIKTHPHARLVMVGDGPERGRIDLGIKNYELGTHVFLEGWHNDLDPYWQKADAYLLTSNYEGYGRTIVDALNHGVPVVMTDVGVAGEIVQNKENGLIVPVGDERALTEAMREAMHCRFVVSAPVLLARNEYLARMKAHWEYALRRFYMPKLVYIVPEYYADIGTHFYYLGGFIKKIAERMRVCVIEEKRARLRLLPQLVGLRAQGFRDIYVHYSFYGALMGIIVTKVFGGRVFYWNCGMPWLYEKERSRFEEWLFRFILCNTILVTGTEGMAEQYRHHYQLQKDCMRVMPNWIDLSLYRDLPSREQAREALGMPLDKKIVLFVHRLSKRKGAHRIVPTAEILQDILGILFVIVGSGPQEQQIKRDAKRHAGGHGSTLNALIRFEGSVPARKIPLSMRAADVFFMPSDEEGFPHVLLEAMAAGTPFAASDVGGVAEIIPSAAKQFLCQPNDVACFARHIALFFSKRNDDFSEELRKHVQRYDIETIAEKFVMLYK